MARYPVRYDPSIDAASSAPEKTDHAEPHTDSTIPLVEVRQPKSKPIVLAVRDEVEIGRDCDGLVLSDPEVSRRHVILRFDGHALTVEDLGSTNGTMVNGAKIDSAVPLSEHDIVFLGRTELQPLAVSARAPAGAKPKAQPMKSATSGPRGTTFAAGGGPVVRGKSDASGARMTSIDVIADAVEEENTKVAKLAAAGGTMTIVFSDIESSTELAMSLGDTKWFDVLGEHNEVIRKSVKQYDGIEIKSQGDGFMLAFPGARSAVLSMIDVQREFERRAAQEPEAPVRIRIGVHTGEAIVDAGGDLFGKHIILTARIANLAHGGQILASAITKEITSSRGDLQFGEAQDVTLKGIEGTYQVFEVIWAEPDDETTKTSS
jgi:class 3 adenylate cyclase